MNRVMPVYVSQWLSLAFAEKQLNFPYHFNILKNGTCIEHNACYVFKYPEKQVSYNSHHLSVYECDFPTYFLTSHYDVFFSSGCCQILKLEIIPELNPQFILCYPSSFILNFLFLLLYELTTIADLSHMHI